MTKVKIQEIEQTNKAAQLFHQVLDETPESIKMEIDLSFAVADRIDALLKRRGMTQKELARLTHTSEAAVCKWLSGTHNFTLSTIGKISTALGAPIINVPISSVSEVMETTSIMVAENSTEYGK